MTPALCYGWLFLPAGMNRSDRRRTLLLYIIERLPDIDNIILNYTHTLARG